MVAEFSARYPEIQISITMRNSREIEERLLDHRDDVATLSHQIDDPRVYSVRYASSRIVVFVNVEHRQGRGIFAEATVKVRVQGEVLHTAAEGNGPVNALDLALRKALKDYYPRIGDFHLSDYKVRILDSDHGTEAITRVLIDTRNSTSRWSTVGAGTITEIIE